MYTHPETARHIAKQRIQEMHARAHTDRQLAEARSAHRSGRTWRSWLHPLGSRSAVRRPAMGYRPRSA
jgi:hypothetical protein